MRVTSILLAVAVLLGVSAVSAQFQCLAACNQQMVACLGECPTSCPTDPVCMQKCYSVCTTSNVGCMKKCNKKSSPFHADQVKPAAAPVAHTVTPAAHRQVDELNNRPAVATFTKAVKAAKSHPFTSSPTPCTTKCNVANAQCAPMCKQYCNPTDAHCNRQCTVACANAVKDCLSGCNPGVVPPAIGGAKSESKAESKAELRHGLRHKVEPTLAATSVSSSPTPCQTQCSFGQARCFSACIQYCDPHDSQCRGKCTAACGEGYADCSSHCNPGVVPPSIGNKAEVTQLHQQKNSMKVSKSDASTSSPTPCQAKCNAANARCTPVCFKFCEPTDAHCRGQCTAACGYAFNACMSNCNTGVVPPNVGLKAEAKPVHIRHKKSMLHNAPSFKRANIEAPTARFHKKAHAQPAI